jgi:hypothetical protein
MDEVVEALEKYKGLVPLVYDVETMGLAEARPQDMQYAVYLKREADKVLSAKDEELEKLKRQIDFLKVTHSSCEECNKCAEGMGKVFDKRLKELKAENERLKATPEEIVKELYTKMLIYPHNMVRLEDAYKLAVALRRSNRKRCLAMAMWCFDEGKGTPTVYEVRTFYWGRWGNIWLALAEEPTWAKFLQLIHKEAK